MTMVPLREKRIGFIGFGNMAEAIARGLLDTYVVTRNTLFSADSDPARQAMARKELGITVFESNALLAASVDLIVLAIKPQDLEPVVRDIRKTTALACPVISILAGVTTKRLETLIKAKVPVVRAMPNMGALVRKSVSALCGGKYAGSEDLFYARAILRSVGEVLEVEERHMDAVTALSGSGPAYFFYLVELMIDSGIRQGLDAALSRKLALGTIAASAALLGQQGAEASALRRRVTSKGGTTEAAFAVFERAKSAKIFADAITAARKRAEKLSGGGHVHHR